MGGSVPAVAHGALLPSRPLTPAHVPFVLSVPQVQPQKRPWPVGFLLCLRVKASRPPASCALGPCSRAILPEKEAHPVPALPEEGQVPGRRPQRHRGLLAGGQGVEHLQAGTATACPHQPSR